MTDFTPWIRPTLIGPFLTSWAFATLGSMTFGLVLPNGERLDNWLIAMLSISFFASMIVVGLIAADVLLLRSGARRLPTGASAWTSALLAPVGVYMTWMFFGWGDGSIPMLVFMIGWPVLGAPLALRWIFGTAP